MMQVKKGELIATFQGEIRRPIDRVYVFGNKNVIEVMQRDGSSRILVYRRHNLSMRELCGYYVDLKDVDPRVIDNFQNPREFSIRDKILRESEGGIL